MIARQIPHPEGEALLSWEPIGVTGAEEVPNVTSNRRRREKLGKAEAGCSMRGCRGKVAAGLRGDAGDPN
jgi:hypothetical protein